MDRDLMPQRQRSHQASLSQVMDAMGLARTSGLDLVVSNDGHHWRFYRRDRLVLNFWPASAKGMLAGRPAAIRIRGYKHAVVVACRASAVIV